MNQKIPSNGITTRSCLAYPPFPLREWIKKSRQTGLRLVVVWVLVVVRVLVLNESKNPVKRDYDSASFNLRLSAGTTSNESKNPVKRDYDVTVLKQSPAIPQAKEWIKKSRQTGLRRGSFCLTSLYELGLNHTHVCGYAEWCSVFEVFFVPLQSHRLYLHIKCWTLYWVLGLRTIGQLSKFMISVTSWALAAVIQIDNGAPRWSTQMCRFEPDLARSVGLGPVRSPPIGAETILLSTACHFHWLPLLSTNKMPFTTWRFGKAGRPTLPFRFSRGNTCLIWFHSPSGTSHSVV